MILIDSDHLSVLTDSRDRRHEMLLERLETALEAIEIPVVAVEEQLRGWLARIRRSADVRAQVAPYQRLMQLSHFIADWNVAPWTSEAADEFVRLRKERVRIGTQDLKIASIALVNDALLLSSNLRDFGQVPGLRVEDWLRA
jgi:tRNA(fMet)-specific endonuclease VapC